MSKSTKHWYPRYTGDYSQKTKHLSMIEHGAYSLLLDHYYSTEKPIPNNEGQIYRITTAFSQEEQVAVMFVINEFFLLKKNGCFYNKRADEEIKKKQDISKKRRNAVLSRGNKSVTNVPTSVPASDTSIDDTSTSTSTSTSKTTSTPTNTPLTPKGENGDFEGFWKSWQPYKTGKGSKQDAKKSYALALKKIAPDKLLQSTIEYCGYCQQTDCNTKNVFRWLNKNGWEDDYNLNNIKKGNTDANTKTRKERLDDATSRGIEKAVDQQSGIDRIIAKSELLSIQRVRQIT